MCASELSSSFWRLLPAHSNLRAIAQPFYRKAANLSRTNCWLLFPSYSPSKIVTNSKIWNAHFNRCWTHISISNVSPQPAGVQPSGCSFHTTRVTKGSIFSDQCANIRRRSKTHIVARASCATHAWSSTVRKTTILETFHPFVSCLFPRRFQIVKNQVLNMQTAFAVQCRNRRSFWPGSCDAMTVAWTFSSADCRNFNASIGSLRDRGISRDWGLIGKLEINH